MREEYREKFRVLGLRIAYYRKLRGLTQEQLAEAIGRSVSFVGQIEANNAAAVKGCSLTVPVFSATMDDYRTHGGIDFACAPGTPVLAAADGTVASVSRDPMMGWTVALEHAGGAVTLYRGLSEETRNIVKAGDRVIAGEIIGASGETALIESAEENHLHFEMAVNGKTVDPADYMDVVMLSDLYED